MDDRNDRAAPIRSFVLRQGRFTPAQQRAFDLHWSRWGLDYTGTLRDLDRTFGRRAPRVLEIGFGNGEQLLHAAQAEPDRDFIGIEVHRPGVGRLLNGLADADVDNVRVYAHDAVDVLRDEFAAATLDEVRIFFPDPWHKKRHHKRRLIQPAFLALLATRVRDGGRLHLATDWAGYAEHMREALEGMPQWRVDARHADPSIRPPWRIETHFELRGRRLGHGVWDFVYERI
ncbi:tRNA (guanosine(46)-N7)-methyltransferase TrmB [Dokdonella sp.]|uniref:tRNA (guanosine(46)-N7)-methyltransferase TrmB n=1 Tax=Dokdonella sp. TaxID=2291710 RepID=UPI0031BFADC1|nr:tRNA (guanosine(46)-N7)-methyltransferase TrmB [Dokdonella sp.]